MVLSCAYHQDGIGALKVANHPWRKPSSGMLQEAQRALGIDLAQSFIVGDKVSDLKAGRSAGLSCGALTLTGYGKAESASHSALLASWRAQAVFDVRVVENAAMAINEWIQEISTRIAQRKQDVHQ
jgi:D-glycero-D-manno-heptose 1,7-bisphosphate phosphatase